MHQYKYKMPANTTDIIVFRYVEPCNCKNGQVLAPWGDRPPMDLIDCERCKGTGLVRCDEDWLPEEYITQILLIKRAIEPWKDSWALPGGHLDVDSDKSIAHCAQRELKEETNIAVDLDDLNWINYYDEIDRDPRGRYITFAFYVELPFDNAEVKAADDAKEFQWVNAADIVTGKIPIAADHKRIIEDFYGQIAEDEGCN